jgi:hypothetical protein
MCEMTSYHEWGIYRGDKIYIFYKKSDFLNPNNKTASFQFKQSNLNLNQLIKTRHLTTVHQFQ